MYIFGNIQVRAVFFLYTSRPVIVNSPFSCDYVLLILKSKLNHEYEVEDTWQAQWSINWQTKYCCPVVCQYWKNTP